MVLLPKAVLGYGQYVVIAIGVAMVFPALIFWLMLFYNRYKSTYKTVRHVVLFSNRYKSTNNCCVVLTPVLVTAVNKFVSLNVSYHGFLWLTVFHFGHVTSCTRCGCASTPLHTIGSVQWMRNSLSLVLCERVRKRVVWACLNKP